jgi:hypothetical protein
MSAAPRVRATSLIAAWSVAVLAATGLGWAAVGLVGDRVSPSGPSALSQAEVQRRIRASEAAASSAPGSSPSTGPDSSGPSSAPPPSGQRTVVTAGGTVVLTCTGTTIQVRSSPQPGYRLEQDDQESGRSGATVTFSNGTRAVQIDGSCQDGVPVATVRGAAAGSGD